jgi:hypothetical protein
MMITRAQRVSVLVDLSTLRRLKKLAGKDESLSSIFDKALSIYADRLDLIAEITREERFMTPSEREAGKKLWERIVSSSTPARSPRSASKKSRSGQPSAKRSSKAHKSSSPRS